VVLEVGVEQTDATQKKQVAKDSASEIRQKLQNGN
jgi:hypothetical protein